MVNYGKKLQTILLVAFVLMNVCIVQVSAQEKGYGAVGAHLTGGFGNGYANCGLGAKLQLNVLHPLRLEGSFNSFIRNKDVSMHDASLNLHWLAFLTNKFCIYPLAGAGYALTTLHAPDTKYKGLETDENTKNLSKWKVCGNFGGGLDYYLTDVIILNFEAKYKYLKFIEDENASRINLSVGIAYLF